MASRRVHVAEKDAEERFREGVEGIAYRIAPRERVRVWRLAATLAATGLRDYPPEYVGTLPLAKNYGESTIYRLDRCGAPPKSRRRNRRRDAGFAQGAVAAHVASCGVPARAAATGV